MTSVFMIFEITQDYQILVPLMVANLLSFVISRRYQPLPVYHALLEQDGVHLPTGPARDATTWAARDVMRRTLTFVAPETSIADASARCQADGSTALLVGTSPRYDGVITCARIAEAMALGRDGEAVESLLDGRSVHAHPDHPLDVVLDRFAQSGGLLPIVSRANAHLVEGAITIDDITRWVQRRPSAPTPELIDTV
jgi:CIC family chloride channel protein